MRSSGGALELSKCFMQVIYFQFGASGALFVGPPRDDLHVELINRTTNKTVKIQSISSYSTYRSLGTMQGICRHQKNQFEYLKNKSIIHTRALVSSQATPTQAMIHHRLCFIPSIAYPTAVCHLSESKLNTLQKLYIAVLLNKLHLSSKHDRRVVFAAK